MKTLKLFGMKITKLEIVGVILSLLIIVMDFIFFGGTDLFYFVLGIAFVIAGFPFFLYLVLETNRMREKDRMFIEFSRNLVESVQAGTPISKSIINVRVKDYGVLNPHVRKLANQISLGIPVKTSLQTFSRDIGSDTISKAINIISESEKAGGEIESILESVVTSVSQIDKLKKERRNAMYGLVVQGYIIFLIFIIIMVVMEFKILPITTGLTTDTGSDEDIQDLAGVGLGGIASGEKASAEELARPFLWLLLIQGFFAGLVIGKLSEGSIKNGLKHSFILMVIGILLNTGIKVFFGSGG
jgi:flagellar protein FlaJ